MDPDAHGISFFVPGKAIPQPRHRVAVRGRYARAYIPRDNPIHFWKALVRSCAEKALYDHSIEIVGKQGFWTAIRQWESSAALQVQMTFFLPKPKRSKKDRPTGRPDLDNLGKAVLDAVTGVLWQDDSQVTEMTMGKEWAIDHKSIGVLIWVGHA